MNNWGESAPGNDIWKQSDLIVFSGKDDKTYNKLCETLKNLLRETAEGNIEIWLLINIAENFEALNSTNLAIMAVVGQNSLVCHYGDDNENVKKQ